MLPSSRCVQERNSIPSFAVKDKERQDYYRSCDCCQPDKLPDQSFLVIGIVDIDR